jgi:hypothetical protein
MKTHRVLMAAATMGLSALAVSSCVYDPYYSDHTRRSGYGYGNHSFSTVHFVSTGNPRWGYDPRVRCYYDYHRRCYYDPYLKGYYPVGYQPVYVHGVPHPYGWSSGHRHISPPSHVRDYRLDHYRQREQSYRNLNQDWSRHIHTGSLQADTDSYQRVDTTSRLFDPNSRLPNQRIDASREPETRQRLIRESDESATERMREVRSEPWIRVADAGRDSGGAEARVTHQRESSRQSERQERAQTEFGNTERPTRREVAPEQEQNQMPAERSEQRSGRSPRAR